MLALCCLTLASWGRAELVVLESGKTLNVKDYAVQGATIHLQLNENGEMSIPLEWVREIRPSPSNPKPAPVQEAVATPTTVSWDFAYSDVVLPLSQKHEVDWRLVAAVMAVESNFKPNAVSAKGASGLMQLMPATAALYNTSDLFDPEQNVEAGVSHLKMLLDRYKGNLTLVLAAYNAGAKAVDQYKGIPPYKETQDYVKKVLTLYRTLSS